MSDTTGQIWATSFTLPDGDEERARLKQKIGIELAWAPVEKQRALDRFQKLIDDEAFAEKLRGGK